MTALSWISTLAQTVSLVWTLALAAALLGQLIWLIRKSETTELVFRSLAHVHQELWIAAPPGLLLGAIENWHGKTPWLIFFSALNMWNWWNYRNWPDENRWKRRGRKAKEAIAERAGRLVVVPAEGAA